MRINRIHCQGACVLQGLQDARGVRMNGERWVYEGGYRGVCWALLLLAWYQWEEAKGRVGNHASTERDVVCAGV